jgi:signal transduction histidine kinase
MSERPGLREALESGEASRFSTFQMGRIAVLASVVIALALIEWLSGTTPEVRGILVLIVADLVLSLPYQLLARRLPSHLSVLALAIMFGDAGFLTVGEYALGESAVYGLPIYFELVVMAAVFHSAQAAYAIAAFATVAYGVMMTLTGVGWIPIREGPFEFGLSDTWRWVTPIVNGATCITLAVVASSLAEGTRRALARSRALESELRDLNRSLEERVADGVQEICRANTSLALKNEQLERTLKQVNLFAGAISHDLRNPITGAGEALRVAEGAESERRAAMLSLARENLLRADEMLIGLRSLMQTVGTSRESLETAVRPVIEDVVREIEASRGDRPVCVQLVGNFGVVEASPEQLAHVFRNLIGNALKHNEDKADLVIEIGQYERGDEVSFFVRDNGVGVPYEVQSRIFEPFYRGPGRRDDSLGLGLALVQAIVSQAGGKVWMDSAPGEGATIRFSLPRSREENA